MPGAKNSKSPAGAPAATNWIRELAAPYLRGYRASAAADSGSLRGYWFEAPRARGGARRGFFAGYLLSEKDFEFLQPQPPECLVFAYVAPVGGAAHRRLVREPKSLLRETFAYIRWLTHRLPRFEFFEDRLPAMVRHRSMRDWPPEKYAHFSRNFFIETCAWLVRSGLVRKLRLEPPAAARRSKRTPPAHPVRRRRV